ncbi:MAG: hypothetical protein JSU70_12740 [Phycisphaerales bacterium]|nr:MAG: hypothetical protein JSU70_12740 [Phycisphaerales bacterium]
MREALACALVSVAISGSLGCSAVGPRSVRHGRARYNIAIQQTNNEQLLLNLVRLRYRDTPYFLEVASVATTFDLTASTAGAVELTEADSYTYGIETGISYSEQPTVTYTPLQGDEFVTQLMSPVDLNTLLLLYHSGWSIERIFRVCLQSMNGLKNAPSASGPTPSRVPVYEQFREASTLLRELQVRGAVEMGQVPGADSNETFVELQIAESEVDSTQVRRLCELLGLQAGQRSFRLTTEVGHGNSDRIAVVTRSLMASLFYVSQGVEAPPEDEMLGRVTVSRDAHGNRFDWKRVTGGLMQIHSHKHHPANTYVGVRYRGTWFCIHDDDLTSKSTFSLLMQLFALQAGDIKASGPVLTLPVGR